MKIKPFLKWAGGKHKIAPIIAEHLPPNARRLVEPFAGSCAVAMGLDFDAYLLNDTNPDLIHLYQTIQSQGADFIQYAQSFFISENNQENRFYDLREQFNASPNPIERSALFVYLNRHGFNGLCRYNQKGFFNVPFGRYKNPYFPEKEMLAFWQKSQRMTFTCGDFEKTFESVQFDDAVYCDPPYVPLNISASFVDYAQGGFSFADQQRLIQYIENTAAKCRAIVVSNHDTPQTRHLYQNAQHIQTLFVQRNIAARGISRQKVGELIAVWKT